MSESPFGSARDVHYMQNALKQATKAAAMGEVPIGAIVVGPTGKIISRAYNKVEATQTQRAHAEMLALEKAARKTGGWRLNGYWLYVTLEPCTMCLGMARLSRIDGIVYGATSPLFGSSLDTKNGSSLYNGDAFRVVAGVCARESADILGHFFKKRRENSE